MNLIKTRKFPKHNYKAIYHEGKTMRLALDPTKPITELEHPEFYDVKITGKCEGKCPWCYMSSTPEEDHYNEIIDKCKEFFGCKNKNERPFQVAIGGGNPNEHPYFIQLLKLFSSLGITPNYTTNGMGLTKEVIDATKKYCGGVAISTHKHLEPYWKMAIMELSIRKIRTNLHLIISDKESVDEFFQIFNDYKDKVEYFVLLPYIAQGRAEPIETDFDYLFEKLEAMEDSSQIAFGAYFYERLKKSKMNISLYEPEILSKFLDLKDMKLYKSSFDLVGV